MMNPNSYNPESFIFSNNYAQLNILENMKIDAQTIADIFEGKAKDVNYEERVKYSEDIRLHSTGETYLIERLLSEKYPGEPLEIRNYKLCNWRKVTKTFFQKIINTISKFQKAEDFNIIHQNTILRDYSEYAVPKYGSVANWFFTVGITSLLQEPNGVFLVCPDLNLTYEEIEKYGEEYKYLPQIYIFSAKYVIWQEEGFFLLQNPKNNEEYFYVDNQKIVKIEIESETNFNYTKKAKQIRYTLLFEYTFNAIPAGFFGGILANYEGDTIYESLISGVCPFWDEALVEFSELNAGIKQHVYPDKWRYIMGSCRDCNGTGKKTITGLRGKVTDTCTSCHGTGDPPTGMFAEVLIQQTSGLEEKPPIPPLGYVKKDFEPIEFLEKHYKTLIYEGLRAINMEFLTESPLSQSGRAKEMDRQESNAFLSLVARHSIKNILLPIYTYIGCWIFPDTDKNAVQKNIAPSITSPVQFDYVLGDADENIKTSITAGIKGSLLAEIEKRYINAKFDNFNLEKTYLLLVNELDPLRGYSVEDKIELYNNGSITQLDLVASVNIATIVNKAIETTYGLSFANKKYEAKMEFVYTEAKKILNTIDSDISKQKQNYELQHDNTMLQANKQNNGLEPSND